MPNRSAPLGGAAEHEQGPPDRKAATWLHMHQITKVYPDGTRALEDVELRVAKGEIHALLGENGAGKSTLMKILSGILPTTSGRTYIGGEEVSLRTTNEALARGIGMVHQHFSLIPNFSAIDNIILGRGKALSRPARSKARARIEALMKDTGLKVPLDTPVELLPVGTQQRVEILKTLDRDIDILILDEPTAVLTPSEADQLFDVMRRLARRGTTSILITHKLREVLAVTDHVTVLRRGRSVGHRPTAGATASDLARMMVGTERLPRTMERTEHPDLPPVLRVHGLHVQDDSGHPAVKNVSFDVRAGEIFAIAGVTGNGQTELVEALTGLRPAVSGEALLNGEPVLDKNPRHLYDMGLSHVPEDRHKLGMIAQFSLTENSILGIHHRRRFHRPIPGTLHWGKVRAHAQKIVDEFDVVTPGINTAMRSLSGGNQQKLVVGRELSKDPTLVVAGQPTRGLDVSAAAAIRDLLVDIRNAGRAVLLISADLDETLSLADRVAVIYEGEFMAVLGRDEFDRERIGLLMGGVQDAGAVG